MSDLKVIQILIKSLAFENADSQLKRVISPLKVRLAAIDEWIWNTVETESCTYDDTWIGEVILKT